MPKQSLRRAFSAAVVVALSVAATAAATPPVAGLVTADDPRIAFSRVAGAITTGAWDRELTAPLGNAVVAETVVPATRAGAATPADFAGADSTISVTLSPSQQPASVTGNLLAGRQLHPIAALRAGRLTTNRADAYNRPSPAVVLGPGDMLRAASSAADFRVGGALPPPSARAGRLVLSTSRPVPLTLAFQTASGTSTARAFSVSGVVWAEGGDVAASPQFPHPKGTPLDVPLGVNVPEGTFWFAMGVGSGAAGKVPHPALVRGPNASLRLFPRFDGPDTLLPRAVRGADGRMAGAFAFHILLTVAPLPTSAPPVDVPVLEYSSSAARALPAVLVGSHQPTVEAIVPAGLSRIEVGPIDAVLPADGRGCLVNLYPLFRDAPRATVDRAFRGGHLGLTRPRLSGHAVTGVEALAITSVDLDGRRIPLKAADAERVVVEPTGGVYRPAVSIADGFVGPPQDLSQDCGAGSAPDGQVTAVHTSVTTAPGVSVSATWLVSPEVLVEVTYGTGPYDQQRTPAPTLFAEARAYSLDGQLHTARFSGVFTLTTADLQFTPDNGPTGREPLVHAEYLQPDELPGLIYRTPTSRGVVSVSSGKLTPTTATLVGDHAGPQSQLAVLPTTTGIVPAPMPVTGRAIATPGLDIYLLSAPANATPLPAYVAAFTATASIVRSG